MNRLLILFGIFDALLILKFGYQVLLPDVMIRYGIFSLPFLLSCFRAIVIVSLAFSAYGLIRSRTWAFIISYFQFPFRLLFLFLSFGFLTYASWIFHLPSIYRPIILFAIAMEAVRLVATIYAHIASKSNKSVHANHPQRGSFGETSYE